jgi:hypothetical protein
MRFAENPSKIKFFLKLVNRLESFERWVWIAWPAKTRFIFESITDKFEIIILVRENT